MMTLYVVTAERRVGGRLKTIAGFIIEADSEAAALAIAKRHLDTRSADMPARVWLTGGSWTAVRAAPIPPDSDADRAMREAGMVLNLDDPS